jgi:hypothetical protein
VRSLRASDADREQVAERLRHATTEGRLTADELDQRLDALYASRTYGELDTLVADLPVPSSRRRPANRVPRWAAAACVAAVLLAVLGALASAVRQSTVSAAGPGGHILTVAGPWGAAHALFAAAASAVSVIAVMIVFVAVIRLLVRSQRPSDV